MNKRTALVVFLAISAILGVIAAEILLIDRPRVPLISDEQRFLERSGGILDARTGLLWKLPGDAGDRTAGFSRKAAQKLCASGRSGGYGDWRLPASHELRAIAHCGPELERCAVVLSREQKAVCLRRRRGQPSWSFWTGDEARRCRDAKGRRPMCARAVRIYRGDCGEYGAVTGMRPAVAALRVICVRMVKKGKFRKQ